MTPSSGAFQDVFAALSSAPWSAPYGTPYTRLFKPRSEKDAIDPAVLEELAAAMVRNGDDAEDSGRIPAGYTYWGQFVAHDLSLAIPDPSDAAMPMWNARSGRLDLECLFGRGPRVDPHLYRSGGPPELLLTIDGEDVDFARNADGTALAGDARNDDNVMVGQVHLAMARAYNRLVSEAPVEVTPDRLGVHAWARRELTRVYQWLVLSEYLPRVLGDAERDHVETLRDTIARRSPDASARGNVSLPIEFVAAAFRFGHSMVRSAYRLNSGTFTPIPLFPRSPTTARDGHLRGGAPLPRRWQAEWARFFDDSARGQTLCQMAAPIDAKLAAPMASVELATGEVMNLALRTLTVGEQLRLPTAEQVAEQAKELEFGFLEDRSGTPLWWAILGEAGSSSDGRLGSTGSSLVRMGFDAALKGEGWDVDEGSAPLTLLGTEITSIPNLLRWGRGENLVLPDEVEGPGGPPGKTGEYGG